MTLVWLPLREQIAQRAQEALNQYQPCNYRVEVDSEAILEDDGWYHVVVKTLDDVRDRDFYDALANAETVLNDQNDGHEYLLVPAIAD